MQHGALAAWGLQACASYGKTSAEQAKTMLRPVLAYPF